MNVVYVVGNSPIRIAALGWEDRPATHAQVADMRAVLRTAMEEGAWGMSTGLDYPPGSYADTDELTTLCAEAARLGGIYHTHVRYGLGDRFLDPFREAIEIGRRSGIAIHITHFYQRTTAPGGARQMLTLVEEAREDGLDVTFDSYPYVFSSTRLNIVIPQWAFDGGPERLRDGARVAGGAGADAEGDEPARGILARDVAHPPQAARAPPVRGPVDRRGGGADGQGPGGRGVRSPAGGGPAGLLRLGRRQRRHAAEVRRAPPVDGRERRAC